MVSECPNAAQVLADENRNASELRLFFIRDILRDVYFVYSVSIRRCIGNGSR